MSRRLKLLAFLSGILLTLSFPSFKLGFLGWIALVPFFLAIMDAKSSPQAMKLGLITGLVFFSTSLYWMIHVHFMAWVLLISFETLFFILFAVLAYEGRKISNSFFKSFWFAFAWLAVEYLRSELPITGLGWNLLAYSQAPYLPLIQIAGIAGAYGLSFVMAWVNAVGMYFLLDAYCQVGNGKWRLFLQDLLPLKLIRWNLIRLAAIVCVFVVLFGYGKMRLAQTLPERILRVTAVQGNIPQAVKWRPAARERILKIYHQLTELSVYDQTDLVIWPEAAFPGYFNRSLDAEEVRVLARLIQTPILVGSPHMETRTEAYNSAYLLDTNGQVDRRYDKQFLVPFGEYVPLPVIFGWLEPVARMLGISDFYAGKESTVFMLPGSTIKFSTLICFEDVFPNVARKFVESGADFLAVITNDAWFGKTSAPYQHLQASIFRAVENGVSVMRAANTGVSAFISQKGEVLAQVEDAAGEQRFVTGRKTYPVNVTKVDTFYRRGGWLFGGLGTTFFFICFMLLQFVNKKKRLI